MRSRPEEIDYSRMGNIFKKICEIQDRTWMEIKNLEIALKVTNMRISDIESIMKECGKGSIPEIGKIRSGGVEDHNRKVKKVRNPPQTKKKKKIKLVYDPKKDPIVNGVD